MSGPADRGYAALIRRQVLEAGAAGTTSSDISEASGVPTSRLAGALNAMTARGEVQAVAYKGWRMYWPAGVEITQHAQHLLQSRIDRRLAARSITVARIKHQGKAANVLVTPPPAHAVPVRVRDMHVRPEGQADYSRARTTVCPAPQFDARFQVDPATRVVGGFASAGIGRYLTDLEPA